METVIPAIIVAVVGYFILRELRKKHERKRAEKEKSSSPQS